MEKGTPDGRWAVGWRRAHQLILMFLFAVLPLICLGIYVQVSYRVADDWFSELLAFLIPMVLLTNLLLIPLAMAWRNRASKIILPLLALLVAQKPMKETVALNFAHEAGEADFRVVSFNVATFNPGRMGARQGDIVSFPFLGQFKNRGFSF